MLLIYRVTLLHILKEKTIMTTLNLTKEIKEVIKSGDTLAMATAFASAHNKVEKKQKELTETKVSTDAIAAAFAAKDIPHTHFYTPRPDKKNPDKKPKGTATIKWYDEHRIAYALGKITDAQEALDFQLSDKEAGNKLTKNRFDRRTTLIRQSCTWVKRLGDAVKKAERAMLPEEEQEELKANDDMVKLREQLVAFSKKANKILTEDVYKSIVKDVQNITIKIS